VLDELPAAIANRIEVRRGGCWLWTGSRTANGYGYLWHDGQQYAHRVVYLLVNGPIPKGRMIHHTCRVPLCVNPEHLELMTAGAHSRLHTGGNLTCRRGHEYTRENTYVWKGERRCRTCQRERNRAYQARLRLR
jgi:hypothetical protein